MPVLASEGHRAGEFAGHGVQPRLNCCVLREKKQRLRLAPLVSLTQGKWSGHVCANADAMRCRTSALVK